MFKKHLLYFITVDGKILRQIKNPSFIPRNNELVKTDDEMYNVVQIVYSLENDKYSCWVYLDKKI